MIRSSIAELGAITKRPVGRPRKIKLATVMPLVVTEPRVLLTRRQRPNPAEYWNGYAWTTVPSLARKLTDEAATALLDRRFSNADFRIHVVPWNPRKHTGKES